MFYGRFGSMVLSWSNRFLISTLYIVWFSECLIISDILCTLLLTLSFPCQAVSSPYSIVPAFKFIQQLESELEQELGSRRRRLRHLLALLDSRHRASV